MLGLHARGMVLGINGSPRSYTCLGWLFCRTGSNQAAFKRIPQQTPRSFGAPTRGNQQPRSIDFAHLKKDIECPP